MDADAYGHVNNVVAYSLFDTAVNTYLIEHGALDVAAGSVVGYVVESGCCYVRPLLFPGKIEVGMRVARIGRSSVTYELALCTPETHTTAAAFGHFVHVYVDRDSATPVRALPDALAAALQPLLVRPQGRPPAPPPGQAASEGAL